MRYSETGMLRLAKGLDLSRQKARPMGQRRCPIPGADPRAQARFRQACPG